MLKRRVVFGTDDSDNRLLKASIAALDSDVLKARFDYTVEFDEETGKTTLYFWRRPTGGFDEQK